MFSWDGFPDIYLDPIVPLPRFSSKQAIQLEGYPDIYPPFVSFSRPLSFVGGYPDVYSPSIVPPVARQSTPHDDYPDTYSPPIYPSKSQRKVVSLIDDYPDVYTPTPLLQKTNLPHIGGYPDIYLEPSPPKKPTFPYGYPDVYLDTFFPLNLEPSPSKKPTFPYGYPDIYLDTFLPSSSTSAKAPFPYLHDYPDVYLASSTSRKIHHPRSDDHPDSAYSPQMQTINVASLSPRRSLPSINDYLDTVYLSTQKSSKNCCNNCIENKPCCSKQTDYPHLISSVSPRDPYTISTKSMPLDINRWAGETFLAPYVPRWKTISHYLQFRQNPAPNIGDYADFITYRIGARYGKAIGSISKGCTIWSIGGNYLITAEHCRNNQDQRPCASTPIIPSSNVSAFFGQYANEALVQKFDNQSKTLARAGYQLGIEQALDRLLSLGVPSSKIYEIDKQSPSDLFAFYNCSLAHTEKAEITNCRDIDYYTCKPNIINFDVINTSGSSRKITMPLLPSHIWGRVPLMNSLQRVPRSYGNIFSGIFYNPNSLIYEGRRVYLLSVNKDDNYHTKQVLLSPGGVITTDRWFSDYQKDIDVVNMLYLPGSSGGALIDLLTNRAIGVLSGTRVFANPFQQWGVRSVSQIISAKAEFLLANYRWTYNPKMDNRTIVRTNTNWITPPSNKRTNIEVQNPHISAGIIGSKISINNQDYIGNLGLISMPFGENYHFELAKVYSPGSIDTHYFKSEGIPFDIYYNEIDSTNPSNGIITQQSFSMCPPEYFLRGVFTVSENIPGIRDSVLRSIPFLFCQHNKDNELYIHKVPEGSAKIGGFSHLNLSRSKYNILLCPQSFFADGIITESSPFINNFQLSCRKL